MYNNNPTNILDFLKMLVENSKDVVCSNVNDCENSNCICNNDFIEESHDIIEEPCNTVTEPISFDDLTEEPVYEIHDPEESYITISSDIKRDAYDDVYYISTTANGIELADVVTIPFDSITESGRYLAGITDSQLLLVLLHHLKDDEKKYNAILDVIKLYYE